MAALLVGCLLVAHFLSSKDEGTSFGEVDIAPDGSSLNGSAVTNISIAVEQMIKGDKPFLIDDASSTNKTTRVKHGHVQQNGTVTIRINHSDTMEVPVTVEVEYYGRDDLPEDAEVAQEPIFTAIEDGAPTSSGTQFSCTADTCRAQEASLLGRQSSGVGCRLFWSLVRKYVCEQVCEDVEVEGITVPEPVCKPVCHKILLWVWIAVSSCFPEDAEVLTPSGAVPMSQVAVGSLVLTPSGSFEPVYFQGHATTGPTLYVILSTGTGRRLPLSPDHYIMADGEHRLAKHVEVGMSVQVRAIGDESEVADVVTNVERKVLAGAYNPLTASGEIYVNSVRASVWSSWFLEGQPGARLAPPERMIPAIYQLLSRPLRWAYALAPEVMKEFCARFRGGPAVSAVPVTELAEKLFLAATESVAGGGLR